MKRFSLILCLILAVSLLSLPVSAQAYGRAYEELSSDAFREAYRLLEEGIAGMAPVIYIPEELGIRHVDLRDIARAVCLDHPEYFWFLESWYYEFTEDGRYYVDRMTPSYYLDNQQVSAGSQALADAMIAFHSKVDEIITGIPVNCTSDYDIALYLHDYLAEHITYTLEGDHDSAYAALVHGEAACYGYSKAYQYLLSRAGVQSRIIVGDSLADDGSTYGHAWNQVWIDGECYYTDITWDDIDEGTVHKYFLVNLEEISEDHIADDMFPLPLCEHSLDFYQRSEGKGVASFSGSTTGKAAAEHFRLASQTENQAVFTCELRFDGDFVSWLEKNALNLVNGLGLSYSTEISYYSFGDVYFLILIDPAYSPSSREALSISLNLTEVHLKGEGSRVQIETQITPFAVGLRMPVYTSDNESVAVVSSSGMVTAVGPGTATVTVTSYDGKVSAQCAVTVEEGDAHIHSLRLIGASDPTCLLDGNDPYYLCTSCFRRFADDAAVQELADVTGYARPATGHINLFWYPKNNSNSHYQVCACGAFIPQTTSPHKDLDEDGLCDVCNAEMSVNEQANQNENNSNPLAANYHIAALIGFGILAAGIAIFLLIRRRW